MQNLRHVRPPRLLFRSLLVGAAATLLVLLVLRDTAAMQRLELRAYDAQFALRGQQPAPKKIVIVTLDEQSLLDLGARRLPIPRRWMADAITFLHRAGARVVGVDYLFADPSTYGAADDRALAGAIQRARNVVLVETLEMEAIASGKTESLYTVRPYAPFARGAAGIGTGNYAEDDDGTIRALDLMQQPALSAEQHPALPLVIASVLLHQPAAAIARALPSNHMLINFTGQQGTNEFLSGEAPNAYQVYHFSNVALGHVEASWFRNKVVLIVPFALLNRTEFATPVGTRFSAFILGDALSSILLRDPIRPAGGGTNGLLILLLGLLAAVAGSQLRPAQSGLGGLLLGGGYAALAVILFQHERVWIDLVAPELALILALAAVLALRSVVAVYRARQNRREISILFVDIRGYTAMSEHLPPDRVAAALDVYLGELTRCARRYAGMITKYVGDEMVVVWNAPVHQPDHPMRAVTAAMDMIARMDGINGRLREKGLPSIRYGIGVNTGEAIVGRMSAYSKQYDVLGDTVNTGARLCSAADGGEVIIGPLTQELTAGKLDLEETDPLTLKGKSRALRTYRVLGIKPHEGVRPVLASEPATSS